VIWIPVFCPLDQVVAIAERVRVITDADARHRARSERQARDDHVDRAEREPLIEIRLLAQARRREDVDVVFAIGALLDLARRPDRPRMVRL
jgi:hypothetical protein